VRQFGIREKQLYREWTDKEQQKLLDAIVSHPLHEVTLLLHRSPASVRSMLRRLGANARMGQDWFTRHTLAAALHVRAEQVQKWIERGWLKCRIVQTGRLKKEIIDAADFCEFCKRHRTEIVGRRLNADRLSFVQTFVFPPSHMELLPVREAKKEQVEFVNRVTNESLETMLPFRTTQVRLVHLMQHLANHSTYHRGQLALMMRQLDSVPLPTDFHVFLVEGRNEAVPAH